MTLDELLNGYKGKYGDAWHLMALDRYLHLHVLRDLSILRIWDARDVDEYLLLKKWVEDMIVAGVRTTEGQ